MFHQILQTLKKQRRNDPVSGLLGHEFLCFFCVRYLDHMLDQLNSHGQLRVSVQASQTAGELLLNFVPRNDHHCFIALNFDPGETSLFMEAAIFGFML